MKERLFVFLLLAVVLLSGCGDGEAEVEWQRFDSEVGHFSILFPGEPQEQSDSVSTAVGPIETRTLMVDDRETGFSASYAEYPPDIVAASDPKLMLDGAREGAVSNINGTLLEEKEITLDGHPGREIRVEIEDEDALVQARFYLVENRLYVLQAIMSKSKVSAEDISQFLDSFELMP